MANQKVDKTLNESRILLQVGEIEGAKKLLLGALSQHQHHPALKQELTKVHIAQAEKCMRERNTVLALISLSAAIELNPSDLSLHLRITALLVERGEAKRASPHIIKILNSDDVALKSQALKHCGLFIEKYEIF